MSAALSVANWKHHGILRGEVVTQISLVVEVDGLTFVAHLKAELEASLGRVVGKVKHGGPTWATRELLLQEGSGTTWGKYQIQSKLLLQEGSGTTCGKYHHLLRTPNTI